MSMAEILGPIGPLADHAEGYAEAGLEVFPVNPTDKTPLVSQHQATCNATAIYEWWKRWPTALIGHRVAVGQVLTDIDPRHGGDEVWRALRAEVGDAWPQTRAHASGRGDGGGHNWWEHPGGRLNVKQLNEWARERGIGHPILLEDGTDTGRWTAGIDLLHHDHRYTILPPSPHPETGHPYRWVDGKGLQLAPAPMPALLVALLTPTLEPAPQPAPTGVLADVDDSIADWYSATARWSDLLGRHGWTLVAGDGESDGSAWRRPQATSAVSATIRHRCLFVYTPNTPFEPTEAGDAHGYTLFRAYTVLEHRGDASAAARAAREARSGPLAPRIDVAGMVGPGPGEVAQDDKEVAESSVGSSWRRTDIGPIVAGLADGTLEPPRPSLGSLIGGGALWYPGRVNGLYGEPGKGKTWIAVCVAAEVLAAGGAVAWIDLEEPAPGIVGRLLDVGAAPDAVVERFIHFAPDESIRHAAAMSEELDDLVPTLIVIDSTGEALALEGAGPNNDDEVANWFRTWPRWLANKTGAGVVNIDHVIKDEGSRGLWPGGSQRKKAAINGSAFMAAPIKELGRGVEGRLKLITAKDRQGFHRTGTKAAEFVLDARGSRIDWRLEAAEALAEGAVFRPTRLMERISHFLEEHEDDDGWATKRRIFDKHRGGVGGNADGLAQALAVLVAEGFVTQRLDGQYHLHRSAKPYRELDDIVNGKP